jgi:hypothetical protein
MTPSVQTWVSGVAPRGCFDCIACGAEIRPTLAVLGSTRCHDCRDEGPGFVGHLRPPLSHANGPTRPARR